MNTSSCFAGSVLLAVAVLPVVLGASRLRARWFPKWAGASARLAESVITLATVISVSELLGAVGGFRKWSLTLGLAATGIVMAVIGGRRALVDAPRNDAPPADSRVRWALLVAGVAVALVVGQWTAYTFAALRDGITANDSLWYHLPHAARFAQDGWLTRLHFTAPEFPDTFHPSNNELLHALGIVFYGRDIVSPLLNLGWMLLTLLAAWCVGRPFGTAPFSVTAAALLLGTPLLAHENAGTASNDVAVLFFVVAAIASLVQPERSRAATVLAAVAAGLALGTKLTAAIPIAALTVVLVAFAGRGRRRQIATWWLVPLFLAGGFWFARNLARTGSPVPSLHLGAGPSPLPSPRFRIVDQLGYSVLHYAGDRSVWRHWFLPGLRYAFGPLWWATLAIIVGAVVVTVAVRPRHRLVVPFVIVAAVGIVGYAATPTTALGPRGQPQLFTSNLMYVTPALVVALMLVALLPALRSPAVLLGATSALGALVVVEQFGGEPVRAWPAHDRLPGIAVAVAGVGVIVAITVAFGRHRRLDAPRPLRVVAAGVIVVALIGGVYATGRRYLTHTHAYDQRSAWARDLDGARIAIAGFAIQYQLYGDRLTNRVQYIGHRGPNGEFSPARDCHEWRRQLRAGHYDYVVLRDEREPIDRERAWLEEDPAAGAPVRAGDALVFTYDAAKSTSCS